ncbi:MAG TPA: SDR family oxidoreductase [Haliangiales bacterium]|nr:SDR family oxidoreductase [Haliangiales bacterium]
MMLNRREFMAVSLAACAAPAVRAPERRPMTIVILGGTGFLGPHIVDAAHAHGHTVTLFNRGKTHPGLFPDVEKLHGDRDGDLKALEGRKWDVCIDTSGYVPRIVTASASLLAPNVKRYLFISTVSVYSDFSKPAMDESGPLETVPDPKSEDVPKYYGALKVLCEKAAEAAMPGRVLTVRPGLIVGPGDPTDRFTYWPVRVARGGEVLAPGDGTDPVQFIDARDLAAWCVLALEHDVLGTYNALGPERLLPMKEMLEACRTASGSDAKLVWVDVKFLAEQKVSPWSDMPAWVPATDADSKGFGSISAAKAIARGMRFRPVVDICRDTLAWWKTLPEERRAKLKAGITPDREKDVLLAWARR